MRNEKKYFSNIDKCKEDWEYLESVNSNEVFQSYIWNKSWVESYCDSNNYKPFIVIYYKDNLPIFLAPLMIVKNICFTELKYLGEPFNDYNTPLLDKKNITKIEINKFWDEIINLSYCDIINLNRERSSSDSSHSLSQHAKKSGHRFYYTNIQSDWETYYTSKRSKKSRYNLNRQEKQLKEIGVVEYLKITKDDDFIFHLNELIKLKIDFYKRNKIKNLFKSKKFTRNFINFYQNLFERNLIAAHVFLLNKNLISIHIGYVYKSNFYYIFPAYDYKLKDYSPGILLLKYIMKETFDANYEKFDFTIGDEKYKLSWSNENNIFFESLTYNSYKGFFMYMFFTFKKFMKKIIK